GQRGSRQLVPGRGGAFQRHPARHPARPGRLPRLSRQPRRHPGSGPLDAGLPEEQVRYCGARMNGLLVVLGIAGMFLLLIAPHEGGHFLFAKLFRVRVIEFSIGAGTKLWSVTRGGTMYALRAFPILGYVRMGGMEAGDLEDPDGFHTKSAWQRILILAGGPAANFLLAMVVITGLD